jgi:hypothetical protein
LALFAGAAAAGLLGGVSAAAAALEPHRAAYRLSLADAHQTTGLAGVNGGLVIEWQRACDGWISHQRLGFIAGSELGPNISHDVRFNSWESHDGTRMRYTVRSYEGDRLNEEYRGEAEIEPGRGGGKAHFTAPDSRDVALPPGTVFPTEHMKQVLASADSGKQIISHEVFDGWGYDALTQVNSVIGRPRPLEAAIAADGELASGGGDAWPVSMAYYNVEAGADLPEFEANFLLTPQGVLQELILDYGDFRLKAKLEDFELLPAPDGC